MITQLVVRNTVDADTLRKHLNQRRMINRAREKLELHSCELLWGREFQNEKERADVLLKRGVQQIISNNMCDNMKAPMGNPAKPALTARSSFNMYFGANVGFSSGFSVTRAAYATHSGSASIGLDPRFATLNYLNPVLEELRGLVEKRVTRHYSGKEMDYNCNFNHISIKVYFNQKRTNEHTDIEFNKKHTDAKVGNSQVPGTPVAIMCLGDDKYLKFIKYKVKRKGSHVRKKKVLTFLQTQRKIIILDPRDEFLNDNKCYWKHKSALVDERNGVCVALMFRVVQATLNVYAHNNRIVGAKVPGTGAKERQLNIGWKAIANNAEYAEECKCIKTKIVNRMSKYWKEDEVYGEARRFTS